MIHGLRSMGRPPLDQRLNLIRKRMSNPRLWNTGRQELTNNYIAMPMYEPIMGSEKLPFS